jgi:hypothetical protein
MDRNCIGFAVLVVSGLFMRPAFSSIYGPCDGCSYGQMERAALAHGVGRYVVGSVLTNDVRAFLVYQGNYQNNVSTSGVAITLPQSHLYSDYDEVTTDERDAFSSYHTFYGTSPIGYSKQFNLRIVAPDKPTGVPNSVARNKAVNGGFAGMVNDGGKVGPISEPTSVGGTVSYPTPGINAYVVVNGGPDQNAFLRWLGGVPGFGITGTMPNALASLSVFHIADESKIPAISFTVTFKDGSHIGAYVDSTQLPPQIKVNQNTAVDSHGNSIPPSFAAVAGDGRRNYGFLTRGNETDLGNMRRQIGSFGIAVPSTRQFSCTATRGSIHCFSY